MSTNPALNITLRRLAAQKKTTVTPAVPVAIIDKPKAVIVHSPEPLGLW
jgi:hypothetical protein